MTQPRILEPFGLILELGVDERQFDKDFIVKAAALVPKRSSLFESRPQVASCPTKNGNFYIRRKLPGVRRRNDTTEATAGWVLHATLPIKKWALPTIQVEWHFKKNQPVNLLLQHDNHTSCNYEVHLTGSYVPNEDENANLLRLRGS